MGLHATRLGALVSLLQSIDEKQKRKGVIGTPHIGRLNTANNVLLQSEMAEERHGANTQKVFLFSRVPHVSNQQFAKRGAVGNHLVFSSASLRGYGQLAFKFNMRANASRFF